MASKRKRPSGGSKIKRAAKKTAAKKPLSKRTPPKAAAPRKSVPRRVETKAARPAPASARGGKDDGESFRRASALSQRNTPESSRKCLALLEKALETDPDNARNVALNSHEHVKKWRNRRDGWEAALAKAVSEAERARKADSNDWFTHWAEAIALRYAEQWVEAGKAYGRARNLVNRKAAKATPHDSFRVQADYAEFLVYLGDPLAAVSEARAAVNDSPRGYEQWLDWVLAFALHQNRQYDQAIAVLAPYRRRMVPPSHHLHDALLVLAASYRKSGQQELAESAMDDFRASDQTSRESWWWTVSKEAAMGPFATGAALDREHWLSGLRGAGLPEGRPD